MNILNRLLILLLLTLIGISPVSAEVFKRTNPDGSVEFTDVRSKQKEEPIKLSPMSTFKAQTPTRSTPPRTTKASTYLYNVVRITSPANESTIRDNSGAVKVQVSITPSLHRDHKLILLMDGKPKGESSTGRFMLQNIDRGSHNITAQIVDKAGKLLVKTLPSTFYLHRQSIIKPNRSAK